MLDWLYLQFFFCHLFLFLILYHNNIGFSSLISQLTGMFQSLKKVQIILQLLLMLEYYSIFISIPNGIFPEENTDNFWPWFSRYGWLPCQPTQTEPPPCPEWRHRHGLWRTSQFVSEN